VRRCRRRDADVGAVLLGTNKARKNRNPNTHVNAQKFGAKRTHKSCQNLYQDNARFYVKVSNGCQKGYYDVKMGCQNKTGGCWRMYTGFSQSQDGYFRSISLHAGDELGGVRGGSELGGRWLGAAQVCWATDRRGHQAVSSGRDARAMAKQGELGAG
jgi:hypothetical protein